MKSNSLVRGMWRSIRRMLGMMKWGISAFPALTGARHSATRRLLLIYDFASQPFSVGDILIFQEASLVLREMHGLGEIDFAAVYDPAKPVVADPAFSQIDPDSFLFHLSSFLPAAQVNPHLGSLFLFDSHRRLESFIADNISDYHVWPTLAQYASREYLFYYCFNELFYSYYQQHGVLPRLASRPAAAAWAAQFVKHHVHPAIPVTVQLRRNSANPARDSNYDSWLAFFEHCEGRYPVKFVVVCAPSEVDARLRGQPNVIVAKDHCTTVEQDLALIEAAQIHMGATSGPGTIAQFSSKPYCMFNLRMDTDSVKGFVHEGNRNRFFFSSPVQTWIVGEETPELLVGEFERLWAALGPTAQHAGR
ncbi:MAG: hypothetical protein ACREUQ_09465 [Burkholderiales bacterium]